MTQNAGQMVVLGELSPIAGAALLFLSRLSPQQSTEHHIGVSLSVRG
jgi:hypothetical protein